MKVDALRFYPHVAAEHREDVINKAEKHDASANIVVPQKQASDYFDSYNVLRQQDPALVPMPRPTLAMLNYMSRSHFLPEHIQERVTQMAAQLDSIPSNSEVTRAQKDLSMVVSYVSSIYRELQRNFPPKFFPELTQIYQMTQSKVFNGGDPYSVGTIMSELSVIVGKVTGVRADDALEKMHLDMQNKPLLKDYDYMA